LQPRTLPLAPLAVGLTAVAGLAFLINPLAHSRFAAPVSAADLPTAASSDQARIVAAVKRDKPSVVALEVSVNGTRYVPIDPFGNTEPQTVEGRASGSGFVYDGSGTIVTNAHVVSPPSGGRVEKIDVLFANGDRVPGRVTAVDRNADLALVKVDRYAKLPAALPLGDSKKLDAGQWAIAIGEPFELRQSVTVGVVSGFDRSEPIDDENGARHVFRGLLQTSAPINPGNSGGPLIDIDGRVIGINQSVAGGAQGIGFAIPVDTIRTDVTAMLSGVASANGDTSVAGMAFIGVQLAPVAALGSAIQYDGQGGVGVQAVTSGGPADTSGVSPGDVIEQIDGRGVDSPSSAAEAIHAHHPGQTVRLKIWRAGAENSVAVVAASPPQVGMLQPSPNDSSPQAAPAPDDRSQPDQQDDAQSGQNGPGSSDSP
jgi:S1-C subfamily serine protease